MNIDLIKNVITPILSVLIGGLLTLLGVGITLKYETKKRKEEQIDKAKPIIINYMSDVIDKNQYTPRYIFSNDEETVGKEITGIFKNTDNGILFFEYIETETKKYYPQQSSAVDKNTVFYLTLNIVIGETLKKCIFHCHDILGTKYYYEASFCFECEKQSKLKVGNIKKK